MTNREKHLITKHLLRCCYKLTSDYNSGCFHYTYNSAKVVITGEDNCTEWFYDVYSVLTKIKPLQT